MSERATNPVHRQHVPDISLLRELKRLLVEDVASHGQDGVADQLFSKLIEDAIESAPESGQGRTAKDLAVALALPVTKVSSARVQLNRQINRRLEAAGFPFNVFITKHRFALRFSHKPLDPKHHVEQFWQPYLDAGRAYLLYPEPRFFKNSQDTYFRNHRVNEDDLTRAAELIGLSGVSDLEPSQSFVPSGFVGALVGLFEHFGSGQLSLRAQPLRWADALPDFASNLILLGTSSSLKVLGKLADDFPFQSSRDDSGRNLIRGALDSTTFVDDSHSPMHSPTTLLKKFVIITRRRRDDHLVTAFSGHSRAVEAATRIFAGRQIGGVNITHVASEFGAAGIFPLEMQVVLRADASWAGGDLEIRQVHIERAWPR